MTVAHAPVLVDEVALAVAAVSPRRILDATVGAGGHAERLLETTEASLLAVDRDPAALELARSRLERFGPRVTLVQGRFSSLPAILAAHGGPVDALCADLGVSSMQIDDPARGFSFRGEGPLDMRMDPTEGATLAELLAATDADSLADVLYHFGDERRSRRIARSILAARDAGRLATTLDLAAAVRRASGPHRGRIDPATRTFQALRMLVNDEVGELEALLAILPDLLAPGGRAAVIAFHSVEDRLVKHSARASSQLEPIGRKPVRPSAAECARNPRARSARLRVVERRP